MELSRTSVAVVRGKMTNATKTRIVAIVSWNDWLLPRKIIGHETNVFDIGYCHKYLSPRAISRHDSLHVALNYLQKPNLSHQVNASTGKNVATFYMVVAIEHFVATIIFVWQ
jgi:hypothetical protein